MRNSLSGGVFDPRASNMQLFGSWNRESSLTKRNPTLISSPLLLKGNPPDNSESHPIIRINSKAAHRVEAVFSQLRNELEVKKAKCSNLQSYYKNLQEQLHENFRVCVLELENKRTEAVRKLEKLFGQWVDQLNCKKESIATTIFELETQVENCIEDIQAHITNIEAKMALGDYTDSSKVEDRISKVLAMPLLKPEADYSSIELSTGGYSFAVTKPPSFAKSTQTRARTCHKRSCTPLNRRELITLSELHKEPTRIPFLGLNKVKVFLSASSPEFYVATLSGESTAYDLLRALRVHLDTAGSSLAVKGTELKLSAKTLLSPLVSKGTELVLVSKQC